MSEPRWHCPRPGDLILRHWEDGTVVYDDSNGELQCLSPAFGVLMDVVLATPAGGTAGALAMALIGEAPTDEEVELVENALSEFSNLRLVERAET